MPELSIAPDGACQICRGGKLVGRLEAIPDGVCLVFSGDGGEPEEGMQVVCTGEPFKSS